MTNPTQREYPDDMENTAASRDQLDEELSAPEDQTGLVGASGSPDDSGLTGTPASPDNSGLAGSAGAPRTDQGVAGGAPYGNDTDYAGTAADRDDADFTGNYGSGPGGPGLSGQTRTPETDLLDPGYNPQTGGADRLDDFNRSGQPGAPNSPDNPDNPSALGRPTPSSYFGAPNSPGISDQAGTQDQTIYTNQLGTTPTQGGATRPAEGTPGTPGAAANGPTEAENAAMARADQGARQTGAMINDQPRSAAANDIPTHGDEAATRLRSSRGPQSKPLPPGPDAPVTDAPQYDVNSPTWNAGSRSTPENPIPEQPTPGLMDRPGPEAET